MVEAVHVEPCRPECRRETRVRCHGDLVAAVIAAIPLSGTAGVAAGLRAPALLSHITPIAVYVLGNGVSSLITAVCASLMRMRFVFVVGGLTQLLLLVLSFPILQMGWGTNGILWLFAIGSLLDRRSSRARLLRDRLASVQKAAERKPSEELALLRDEMLSEIPALDNLLRRSARISNLQTFLSQADLKTRAGNILMLCVLSGVAVAFLLASTVVFLADYFWPWGWAIGAVLLLFSFPNDAEKRGYHDF